MIGAGRTGSITAALAITGAFMSVVTGVAAGAGTRSGGEPASPRAATGAEICETIPALTAMITDSETPAARPIASRGACGHRARALTAPGTSARTPGAACDRTALASAAANSRGEAKPSSPPAEAVRMTSDAAGAVPKARPSAAPRSSGGVSSSSAIAASARTSSAMSSLLGPAAPTGPAGLGDGAPGLNQRWPKPRSLGRPRAPWPSLAR